MDFNTQGIVLRKLPYTGGAMVVTIYTRQRGVVTFMAKGMGRKGSGMSKASIQALSRVELQGTFRENRQMQVLKGLRTLPDAALIMESPPKAAVAMFLAEIFFKCLREESPDEDLFLFLDDAMAYFAEAPFNPDFHLVLLMHLSRYFGFFPSGSWSSATPCFHMQEGTFAGPPADNRIRLEGNDAELWDALAQTPFGESLSTSRDQKISHLERRILLGQLMQYYELHLEGMGKVKSLAVLMEVFS